MDFILKFFEIEQVVVKLETREVREIFEKSVIILPSVMPKSMKIKQKCPKSMKIKKSMIKKLLAIVSFAQKR